MIVVQTLSPNTSASSIPDPTGNPLVDCDRVLDDVASNEVSLSTGASSTRPTLGSTVPRSIASVTTDVWPGWHADLLAEPTIYDTYRGTYSPYTLTSPRHSNIAMPRHRDHWTPPYASSALALRPPPITNPPLRCIPICVSSRHGSLGITRSMVWYLCGEPPSRAKFRIGSRLYMKDVDNDPLNLILTIVNIVGIGKYWVTFGLADFEFGATVKHTIAIPMQFAHLPMLYHLFHHIFSNILTDDFPDVSFPLPRLAQPQIRGEDQNTHVVGALLQQSEPRPSGTPVLPGAYVVAPCATDSVV